MSGLALFAETPRAGDLGHRFLLAGDNEAGERLIAAYVTAIDKDESVGANFIGVARSVRQHAGTAVRTGREIIVLAGVDVSRMTASSRDRVLTLLHGLLDQLERLVLNEIDWSRVARADLVIRSPELSRWLREAQNLGYSEISWTEGPHSLAPADTVASATNDEPLEPAPQKNTGFPSRRILPFSYSMVAALLIAASLLAAGAWFLSSNEGNDSSVEIRSPEQDRQRIATSQRAIHELASEWDCPPEDVVRSLLRAANWDRRREAANVNVDTAQADGEVQLLLKKVTSKKSGERLLVSSSVASEPDLRRFVVSRSSRPATARAVRGWLYDGWKKWEHLHESEAIAHNALSAAENSDEMASLMVAVARIEPDVALGDEFRNPDTPLFDRQDVMIWRFLNQCRVKMEDQGINQFLGQPVASPPDSELASFVAAVRTHRGPILARLAQSRSQTAEAVGKSKGEADEKLVTGVYRAYEDFIEHLARFNFR